MKRILTMCIAACLLAMAPLSGTQAAYDVTSYGVVADGKTRNAEAINYASRNLPPAGAGLAHQEEVRVRPTNEWTRVGPLGETPKRTTDALPLSDQENRGDWVKYEPMSDDFEGGSLDTNKWVRNMHWWKGRQPALFKAENVTVSDGQLLLTMRKEPVPEEFQALGYRDYTSAAVHSLDRTCYGYFEVKAKPMNSAGSSSFWFQQDAEPGWATEIDVFEIGGKAPGFESKYNMNLHVFRTPAEKRHWNVGGCWTAPWPMADDYHIYGLEWNKEEILYYVDGVVVRKVKNTQWHQPLYLIFDSETMPNWFGMPDDRDLPSTFHIEYVRAWKKQSQPTPADDWVLVLDDASKQLPAPGSTPVTGAQRLQWWREARFGLFVHWGPVSLKGTEISWSRGGPRLGVPAQVAGEVPVEVYDNLYKEFNPTNFNARQWVEIARAAGMRYIVLTAKHCDGFCLWPTKVIDYHIGRTPFQRDICGELADAVHEAGLRLGWYYSPMDWYDPDCRTERNAAYVARMQAQLRELLTNYGRVDLLWFDRDGGPTPWDQPATYQIVKTLQPGIVINNRLDWGDGDYVGLQADYFTPEQFVGSYNDQVPWETCMTLGTQWSWKPGDTIKSVKETIRILARCAGGDGNLLLNVGPMPSGEIEPRQVEVLKGVGAWLAKCGESIYGTRGGPFKPDRYGACTRKANTLFLHIFNWCDEPLKFPAIPAKVVRSRVLTGGLAAVRQTDAGLEVSVPESDRHPTDTVVAIDLDGPASGLPVLTVPRERSLTTAAKATASNVFQQQAQYGADKAVDGNDESRWATDSGTRQAWLEVDLGRLVRFTRVMLAEAFPERVRKFELQYLDGADWKTFCTGGPIGEFWTRRFEPVNARQVRFSILDATEGPTIWEFQLFE
jgi:alpha-L-fucosidase